MIPTDIIVVDVGSVVTNDLIDLLPNWCGFVIDGFIEPILTGEKLAFFGSAGRTIDFIGAQQPCKLAGRTAHGSGSTRNEHVIALLNGRSEERRVGEVSK